MRHTIDLLLGSTLGQVGKDIKQYISKCSEGGIDSFFQVIDWKEKTASKIESVPIDKDIFCSDLNELYKIAVSEPEMVDSNERIRAFFSGDLFRNTLNVKSQDEDDIIGLNIICLLYDNDAIKEATNIVKQIGSTGKRYQIDLIGLHHDLAHLFFNEKEKPLTEVIQQFEKNSYESIKEISTLAEPCFHRFLILQDCNAKGVSLNLDNSTFTKILGEYSMVCIENYHSIYPQSEEFEKKEISAIGLSQLFFDKYYFVQYLLRSAYLKIFDNEKISDKDVDVNKVSKLAQEKLMDHTNILSEFFDNEITPLMRNNKSDSEIMTSITPKFNSMVDELSAELQSFIEEPSLSLPEKKAILAQLLGQDNELVTGYIINNDLLTLDDCETESLNLFVEANNNLVKIDKDDKGEIVITPAVLEYDDKETGKTDLHIKSLKNLRENILRSTTYIREKSKDLEVLSSQIDNDLASNKLLTDNGFIFGKTTYKLIIDVKEILLENTYEPTIGIKLPESVDLRSAFTEIKDQGTIGACAVFSIVSIYEYVLKKSKTVESDLSERFVYYNVRVAKGSFEDNGNNYFEVISNIINNGICEENFCKYDNDDINTPPSELAKDNALTHKIQIAKNIKINHDDFLSALSEGYPIAISLSLSDSFGNCPGGFVMKPSEEEIKGGIDNRHAMVICGYSQKDKIYIVRNSWGESFGDHGYCYIPFSYIEDENLNDYACIITTINDGEETKGYDNQTTVSFNETDANIKYALLRIAIEDEKHNIVTMQKEYTKLIKWHEKIVLSLGNPSVRDKIYELTYGKIADDLVNKKNDHQNFIGIERKNRLDEFNKEKTRGIKIQICIMLALIFTWSVGMYFSSNWISYTFSWINLGVLCLCVLYLLIYLEQKKHQLHQLKEKLDDEAMAKLNAISKRIDEQNRLKLKMRLAGMLIDKFASLQATMMNKYSLMKSYVGNLSIWYDEEKNKLDRMQPVTPNDTFIPLITNDVLDIYFNENKEKITKEIHLYELFRDYDISELSIRLFKDKIKKVMIDKLLDVLKDFSIYKHISGEEQYPYLNKEYANIKELLNPTCSYFLSVL